MGGVVGGNRQKAYLNEFYPVVWLKIAPKAANCCPPGSPTIFDFSAVFSQNFGSSKRKKIFQHHGAPKPLRNHLQRTPLTKPSAPKLVWTHMDVWEPRFMVFYASSGENFAAGAAQRKGEPQGPKLPQPRVNRLNRRMGAREGE